MSAVDRLVELLPTAIGVVALLAVTVVVLSLVGVGHRWSSVVAVLRGALQLAAISVVLTGIIDSAWGVAAALGVMFTVAAVTSARRVGWSAGCFALTVTAMGAGVGASLSIIFATGAIEFTPRYVLALGGIVIGGAMSASTVTGRRLGQAIDARWDEIEGWLALGATPRRATIDIARHAIREGLLPSTDQTRTTGLVTLPGAFVGAIFGGIAPLEAGRFQIVVLAGILAAATIAASSIAIALAPRMRRLAP